MSDNIKQEFYDLYKQASKYGVSESEKNRLVERIIKLTHHPDFCLVQYNQCSLTQPCQF